ncbi:hypothetical protein DCAR_0833012 [Daucus carota subsp. sativus]|uniref:Disease resistance protein Roq1-like winged-helix domain-containing protein n=1 Tax=Daucus carota subsp. sativus TaxID=79200 RepID=A0AAF0XUA2_DAUCS|nr:hypothetical protein DCAR_0833012 [Daucus carota subsp. sativus]
MREWFHQGSKIIVTTRNVHLLNAFEHCTRYTIKTLNSDDSLELFSWHAFQDNSPPECYIEQSERIIKQCQGLPLALKVLGASLRGKKLDVWRCAIEKLEIIPHCKIQKILRISYDSLQDDHDRDLFLEIVCFFSGEAKSFVVGILDECDYYTLIGIDNLIDRCLLKTDKYGNIKMHQLVQSMGREIIRQQSPRDPGLRSRLNEKTNAYQAELGTKAFSMMHKLRLLKLNNVRLSGGYKDFPKSLKCIDFPLSSLVAIDMQSSKLQTFNQGNMLLGSLKFLNLSHCHDIVKTPNFAKLYALEHLLLEDCPSLVEIDESIGMAGGLVLINLKDCKRLRKLPENFCMLKLLEILIISGCSSLCMFPAEMRKIESLKVFHADGLDFSNSSYTSHQNESWRKFIWNLVAKPRNSPQLTSLPCNSITSLSLANCNLNDNSFPRNFRFEHSLEYLNLSMNPIRFLPDCFRGLKAVKRLLLRNCNQLQILEDLPETEELWAFECPSLEKITLKPGLLIKGYVFPRKCKKLLEMENLFKVVPIDEIDPELINNCGIYDVEFMKTIQIRLYNGYTSAERRCPIQVISVSSL